jgi:hypothetical protein
MTAEKPTEGQPQVATSAVVCDGAIERIELCPVCFGLKGEWHWHEKTWRDCDRCTGKGHVIIASRSHTKQIGH